MHTKAEAKSATHINGFDELHTFTGASTAGLWDIEGWIKGVEGGIHCNIFSCNTNGKANSIMNCR